MSEESEADNDEPWAEDALDRKAFAQGFLDRVRGAKTPLCVAVRGSYGSGKTFMLENLHDQLVRDKKPSIYFNAWENEIGDEPLMSLLACVQRPADDDKPVVAKVMEGAVTVAKKAGPILGRGVLRKIFGQQAVQEFTEVIGLDGEELANALGEAAQARLTATVEAQKAVAEVKKEFSGLVGALGGSEQNPLFIFIDELDRCRPTYAIRFLEDIQHLLKVENCVFVVGVDGNQLTSTVKAVYGPESDAVGYVLKFFDWQVELPGSAAMGYTRHLLEKRLFLTHLFEGRKESFDEVMRATDGKSVGVSLEAMDYLEQMFALTLRDVERILFDVDQHSKTLGTNHFKLIELAAFVSAVRIKVTNERETWLAGRAEMEKALDALALKPTSEHKKLSYEDFREFLLLSWLSPNDSAEAGVHGGDSTSWVGDYHKLVSKRYWLGKPPMHTVCEYMGIDLPMP